MKSETERLAALSETVRASTLQRFRCVAPGDEAWRPAPDTLSFVDVVRHLCDADEWLFGMLQGGRHRRPVIVPGEASAGEWEALLANLVETGKRRTNLLRSLSPTQLDRPILDPEVCGPTDWWWLITRANFDHEIHHRGAVQLALRLRYGREIQPRR